MERGTRVLSLINQLSREREEKGFDEDDLDLSDGASLDDDNMPAAED